ncbi:MAG TPA: hypothetical protein VNX65_00525 [Patescibacteria group bacterium]|nr:hypothetical protein [Patescibacteria group bacterium]
MLGSLNKTVLSVILGFLIGIVVFIGVRFVWLPNNEVHYHANFAVFINGKREPFSGTQYYQEVAMCGQTTSPQSLIHMHDNNNHVVHVHANTQTWGQFFNNLGWVLGDTLLSDGTNVYQDGANGKLSFILNGKATRSIANEIIQDKDRLLISFGVQDSTTLQKQSDQVESDAAHFDVAKDPSTCSGPEKNDWLARLNRAIW